MKRKKTKRKNQKVTGRMFVIEGGDGSGKKTQAELLFQALQKAGHRVATYNFPQYEHSIFGWLCGDALKGNHGDFRHMSPYIASLPYMLDRLMARESICASLEEGLVICDRWTPSNIGFQAGKLVSRKERDRLVAFLEEAEYENLSLPRPTLVIYLHVPAQISNGLVAKKAPRAYLSLGKKRRKMDQHEIDVDFQRLVARTYLELAKARPDWVVVDCAPKGIMLSREDIHGLVMAEVGKVLETRK